MSEEYYVIGHTPDEGEINDGEVITEQSGVMSFQQEVENFLIGGQPLNDQGDYDYDENDKEIDSEPLPHHMEKLDVIDEAKKAHRIFSEYEKVIEGEDDKAKDDAQPPSPAADTSARADGEQGDPSPSETE